ncbi:uncharacterized protein Dwil_GK21693 [Drosophila willistoni]|uniref:GK21693 n=1 Tax=Drosophila willistoni TaxID=7260 RepID=B4MPF5_DROWI|nr:uncharacterized protein LOC6640353 [Drosophila willistoni]EDW73994.1 uncharacterized protein Dwil_GK21693 [Drosophila willistoni]
MSLREEQDEDVEVSAEEEPTKTNPPTFWYDINEVIEESICPSCGRPMTKFKNRCAHIKRCFAIRKLGPVYRIKGYMECKCGMLINDNPKAQKLHVCAGEVPAFEPHINYNPPVPNESIATSEPQLPILPLKPKHRVRNFDLSATNTEPDVDCDVYSIERQDSDSNDIIVAVKICSKLRQKPTSKVDMVIKKRLMQLPGYQNDVS